MVGTHLRVGAYSRGGGHLFNDLLDRVGVYSSGSLIGGGTYPRIKGMKILQRHIIEKLCIQVLCHTCVALHSAH